jgi:hypothetical protein
MLRPESANCYTSHDKGKLAVRRVHAIPRTAKKRCPATEQSDAAQKKSTTDLVKFNAGELAVQIVRRAKIRLE